MSFFVVCPLPARGLRCLVQRLAAGAPWAHANEADFPAVGRFNVVTQQSAVWRTRDGAPNGSPPIAQTPDGWMWFAGSGLYRFDGVHFERVNAVYGHALPSDAIHGIQVIGDTLWLGYMYGGISRFSRMARAITARQMACRWPRHHT